MVSADQLPSALDPPAAARAYRAVEPWTRTCTAPRARRARSARAVCGRGGWPILPGGPPRWAPSGAGVVTATFYNSSPSLVADIIPRAWTLASPEQVCRRPARGRWRLPDPAARAPTLIALAPSSPNCRAAPRGLRRASPPGSPPLRRPRRPPLARGAAADLWHAATLLREHRGDGHIAALLAPTSVASRPCHLHRHGPRASPRPARSPRAGGGTRSGPCLAAGSPKRGPSSTDAGPTDEGNASGAPGRKAATDAMSVQHRGSTSAPGAPTRVLETARTGPHHAGPRLGVFSSLCRRWQP